MIRLALQGPPGHRTELGTLSGTLTIEKGGPRTPHPVRPAHGRAKEA